LIRLFAERLVFLSSDVWMGCSFFILRSRSRLPGGTTLQVLLSIMHFSLVVPSSPDKLRTASPSDWIFFRGER
jgi:hypothetical protein